MDEQQIVLLYDLHAPDGSLIAPHGTAVQIVTTTEEQARQALKNNLRTFKRFDDPDRTAETIQITGRSGIYAVTPDMIG